LHSRDAQKLFRHAAEWGDVEVVKAFIEEGADPDASFDSITPLQIARGADVVKVLIDAGANINATSEHGSGPPLEHAAELGDVDSIQVLLKAGAKVNGKSSAGWTALMGAAESGNPDAVRALLSAGADVHSRNNSGNDALDFAHFGLNRCVSDEGKTGPFTWSLPYFRSKFKLIEELLVAAGATPEKPAAK
jgi:ankyrin repeat protein